jgi:hypothetical protein
MNTISGASLTDSLVNMASNLQASKVAMQIGVAVLKQIQDQQKAQAQALINMISQTPSLDGTGQVVDVSG